MKTIPDIRRLRVYQVSVANGIPVSSSAADVLQGDDGEVFVAGLWNGVLPLMPEDMQIRASRVGISPLEWLRLRLLSSPFVEVEVIDAKQ